ncbi:hypothetical protein [Sediminicoccus sp. KRV36]|uniref:hypothetical protein n=1 Tax=Sediminicoccus sp. KRV36 TaxID=3133721 RepID=UPI00200BB965|nr:hypothetical protein [Sediminicoccus rosea]UPY37271.1 hypothetical protein LHU95_00860 [Sediminicoccus rosea]
MTFFSSGVMGPAADDATIPEAIPQPFLIEHKNTADRAMRFGGDRAIQTGLLWRRRCAGSN